jgi:multicomponent Na+:H+ antiporter subunit G
MIREILTSILLVLGGTFMFLSAVGILRMPDLYTRMSATSKAASLGSGLMLVAVAVHFNSVMMTTRALAAILFIFLTVPVAAHVIGRAAYQFGVPLWSKTVRDDLKGRYAPVTFRLAGELHSDLDPAERPERLKAAQATGELETRRADEKDAKPK